MSIEVVRLGRVRYFAIPLGDGSNRAEIIKIYVGGTHEERDFVEVCRRKDEWIRGFEIKPEDVESFV
jgi:hypothetical protein